MNPLEFAAALRYAEGERKNVGTDFHAAINTCADLKLSRDWVFVIEQCLGRGNTIANEIERT